MTKLKESSVYTAELLLFFLFPLSLLLLDVHKKFLFPSFALNYRKMDKLLLFFNGEPKLNMQIGLKMCKYFRMHVSVGGSVTVYTRKHFFASRLS